MRVAVGGVHVAPEGRVLEPLLLRALGEGELLEAVLRPDALLADVVVEAAAVLADVAGQRDQQDQGAVDRSLWNQWFVPAPWMIMAGLRVPRSRAKVADVAGGQAGDPRPPFAAGSRASFALQQLEDGRHLGRRAVGELDRERPRERRIDRQARSSSPRSPSSRAPPRPSPVRRPRGRRRRPSVGAQVRLAQERPVVLHGRAAAGRSAPSRTARRSRLFSTRSRWPRPGPAPCRCRAGSPGTGRRGCSCVVVRARCRRPSRRCSGPRRRSARRGCGSARCSCPTARCTSS